MEIKKCKGPCGLIKNIDEFRFRKDRNSYCNKCKVCESQQKKEIYYRNHDAYMAVKKIYRDNPKNKEKRREWSRNRYKNNINYRLACALRNRINKAIQINQKSGSTVRDLGCSIEFLKQRLESQFYINPITGEKMTWENYGKRWEIDHIIPLNYFDLSDRQEFLDACCYLNLQPMWTEENMKKHNKMIDTW